ncbi:MAG: 1-deoxy-D-xylulose-5-phosphate synthase [Bacteroidales bacterium]|nr:1-deoxy-D-xylulose-5-phosphate synthase [Bacteroidales bacterium]
MTEHKKDSEEAAKSGDNRLSAKGGESAPDGKDGTNLLDGINSPDDLRALPESSLAQVCSDIRARLISELSHNPGHFASSMGAVELTVALHYVYNTPYDRIVWDVGHQAYAHKLLTGRRDRFADNRKMGGLSGFPNPDESEYDTFTAGHASNSISAALGMAIATQLKKDSPLRKVVAVTGDASISGGLAFEGLNNAANSNNDLTIILNDNNMSIDPNVGSLHSYLAHINTRKGYNNLRFKVYNFLRRHGLISESRRGFILRFNNALKAALSGEQNIFEGLNIRYFGPFNGHDIDKVVKVLRETKDMKGPKILHFRTRKGKGFAPAEADPANWHAPGKFDPVTGERFTGDGTAKPPKYQDVFGETLLEMAREDNNIVAITAAMPSGTSVSVMQEAIPERVFDVGISEGHAVTFAGGLAKDGMRPVVAIYSSFLQRAYDHIIHDVAIQRLPVIFAIDRAGLVGEDGVTHHGTFDIAYLRVIPGMTIASPRNEQWLRTLMATAMAQTDGPFAIRYPRGSATSAANWHTPLKAAPVGKGEILHDHDKPDVVILSVGPIAGNVAKAIDLLAEKGIKAAHYDAVYIKPLDSELLDRAIGLNVPVVTVEDASASGGFGSAVAEYIAAKGLTRPLTIIGIPDNFVTQGTVPQLQQLCGLDPEGICRTVQDAVAAVSPHNTAKQ